MVRKHICNALLTVVGYVLRRPFSSVDNALQNWIPGSINDVSKNFYHYNMHLQLHLYQVPKKTFSTLYFCYIHVSGIMNYILRSWNDDFELSFVKILSLCGMKIVLTSVQLLFFGLQACMFYLSLLDINTK